MNKYQERIEDICDGSHDQKWLSIPIQGSIIPFIFDSDRET